MFKFYIKNSKTSGCKIQILWSKIPTPLKFMVKNPNSEML